MQQRRKVVIMLVGLAIASTLFVLRANANTNTSSVQSNLTVFPSEKIYTLSAGQTMEDAIYVLRPIATSAEVRVSVVTSPIEEQGIQNELAKRSAVSWISLLSPSTIALDAESAETIAFRVTVPSAVQGGDWFAFFDIADEATGQHYQTLPMRIRIEQGAEEHGIMRFSSPERSLFLTNTIPFLTGVENTGTTVAVPKGVIQLLQGGRVIVEAEFNREQEEMIPGVYQLFRHTWEPSLALGTYTARTIVTMGDTQPPAILETSFFVLPWWIALSTAALVLFTLYGGYRFVRSLLWNRIVSKEVQFMQILTASAIRREASRSRHRRTL